MKKIMLVLMSALLVFALSACSNDDFEDAPNDSDFQSYNHLRHYDGLKQYDEKDSVYILYIYATWCGACASISNRVLEFADNNYEAIPIVFAHEGANGNPPTDWQYYPTMMVMRNGEVIDDLYVGVAPILGLLNALEDGTYTAD